MSSFNEAGDRHEPTWDFFMKRLKWRQNFLMKNITAVNLLPWINQVADVYLRFVLVSYGEIPMRTNGETLSKTDKW